MATALCTNCVSFLCFESSNLRISMKIRHVEALKQQILSEKLKSSFVYVFTLNNIFLLQENRPQRMSPTYFYYFECSVACSYNYV